MRPKGNAYLDQVGNGESKVDEDGADEVVERREECRDSIDEGEVKSNAAEADVSKVLQRV
jgi:hypothetical protein